MTSDSPDGVRRVAVVVADASVSVAAPPGVDPRRFALAMCEDVVELVGDLSIVDVAVLSVPRGDPRWTADVSDLCWPGTPVATWPDPHAEGQDSSSVAGAGFRLAAAAGAQAAAIVSGDAPDLPGLLLGKVFRAIGSDPAAVCATVDGALVALAARLPVAGWVADAATFDGDGLAGLLDAAPAGVVVARGPTWHRLRRPDDVRALDPGLEGWAATRALLSAPVRQVATKIAKEDAE